nr:unnamed protein product [Callosobruchus chinensis]
MLHNIYCMASFRVICQSEESIFSNISLELVNNVGYK